ncbi:hypothetical protein SUGI_0371520 [Cryptomeria japonica]|nr:hypothetical protein SUGI_0371520 [Cryptomeria japonica]
MLAGRDVGEHKSGQHGHDRPIENAQWCAGKTVWLPDVDEKIREPSGKILLFTDLKGDSICRICHSSAYVMLVAELEPSEEIVGLIRRCIESVTCSKKMPTLYTKATYILGFRISPTHRLMGIGLKLV